MGQTTTKSIQFQDAAALFSNDELQRIQDIFLRLSVGKKNSLNSGRLQVIYSIRELFPNFPQGVVANPFPSTLKNILTKLTVFTF